MLQTLNRCNVAMAAKFALESYEKKEFLISTTHLLFNPRRTDIRLAQLQILLAELHRIANLNDEIIPIILTGDFNVQQTSEPYRLITGQKISVDRVFRQANFPVETPAKLLPIELGITDDCRHFDIVSIYYDNITLSLSQTIFYETHYDVHTKKKVVSVLITQCQFHRNWYGSTHIKIFIFRRAHITYIIFFFFNNSRYIIM